jgi:nitroreductase
MKFLELVEKRQSERQYDPRRPVARDVIERCLEAARLAPSACNSQPWTFVVVDDPEDRDRLASAAFSGLYSMNRFAAQAPVLVAVVTERSKYVARLGGMIRGVQYSLLDVGAAVEHFLLQAAEEGVGTCWLGWFDEKAVKRVLNLARDAKVDVMIAMGYPAAAHPRPKQRKGMDEIRRYFRENAGAMKVPRL